MLDPGSTLFFLTNKDVNILKVNKIPCYIDVAGLQSTHTATSQFRATVNIKAPFDHTEPEVPVATCLVKSITGKIPAQNLTNHRESAFAHRLNGQMT